MRKHLVVSVFVFAAVISAACSGPPGPVGPEGPQGPPGLPVSALVVAFNASKAMVEYASKLRAEGFSAWVADGTNDQEELMASVASGRTARKVVWIGDFSLDATLAIPVNSNLVLDASAATFSYRGETGDAITIDSTMDCYYQFRTIGFSNRYGGTGSVLRIKPTNPDPQDGFVSISETIIEFSAIWSNVATRKGQGLEIDASVPGGYVSNVTISGNLVGAGPPGAVAGFVTAFQIKNPSRVVSRLFVNIASLSYSETLLAVGSAEGARIHHNEFTIGIANGVAGAVGIDSYGSQNIFNVLPVGNGPGGSLVTWRRGVTGNTIYTTPNARNANFKVVDDSGNFTNKVLFAGGTDLPFDLQNYSFTNLLSNGDFEVGDPPAGWYWFGAGRESRSNTQKRIGRYSLRLTRGGTNITTSQNIADYTRYRGRTVTLGSWVYATVADAARIYIDDGTQAYSPFHSGGGSWE